MQKLTIGSHIKTTRTGYSHHGIYCGNGQVVHYSGFAQAFKKGKLEITTLEAFLGSETKYYVVKYPSDKVRFSSDEVVKRAISRVGEDNYNLVFNNCEHLCVWALTGKSESKQVKNILSRTSVIAIAYKSIGSASAAKAAVATTGISISQLIGGTTGAIGGALIGSTGAASGGTALLGTTSAVSSTAIAGFMAGGTVATTVAAAPIVLPIAVTVGVGAIIGGFLGGFFD